MGTLSGITQVLSPILTLAGVPGTFIGAGAQMLAQQQTRDALRLQQDNALRQLQERQGLEERTAIENANLQKANIAADASAAEERRLSALRRAVARQKTLFSSQGLSSIGDGSNEAVLLGMYKDSDQDAQIQSRSDALRNAALEQNIAQQKQKNLLETTQLAQQQNLARILAAY